jgi:Zn-dependent peptidase ImmA (M78 family)
MKKLLIDINPTLLVWAREEAGYSPTEVAFQLGASLDEYQNFEQTGESIPRTTLERIAAMLKRQTAVFFLPSPPKRAKHPKDFRNAKAKSGKLHPDTMFAIRQANSFQETAIDLEPIGSWSDGMRFLDRLKREGKPEQLTYLRQRLGITTVDQSRFGSIDIAFREWRRAIEEKLGILVFQFSFPVEDAQGFCLADDLPMAIVVNNNYAPSNKTFTLFHEIAHLLQKQSSLCGWESEGDHDELECNDFAGAFLLPTVEKCDDLIDLHRRSTRAKVSREVYLRRLESKKMISKPQFFDWLAEIRKDGLQKQNKKSSKPPIVLPEVKSRSMRGERYYNSVLESLRAERISFPEASRLLDVRMGRLEHEIG